MSTAAPLDHHGAPAHGASGGHDDRPKFLAHHFDNAEQQESAAKLGMWIFLATEILMFSGLFLAYFFVRASYPEMVLEAHEHLDKIMGAINTVVLISSSLTMALAVRSAQTNQRQLTNLYLLGTLVFAATFMVIKYLEYSAKIEHGTLPTVFYAEHLADGTILAPWYGGNQMFFGIYFVMTGLHGLHVLVGMGLITWMMIRNSKGEFSSRFFTPIENVGLYWHLVDLIWIFLFPLLYLVK